MNKVYARIQRYGLLAAELLQHHRICNPSELANFVWIQIIERVWRHQQRQAVDLEVFRRQSPRCQKRSRDDCGRGNAVFFQVGRVVDTPRRAAPSITPGVDDALNLADQFIGDQPARGEVLAHLEEANSWIVL